MNDLNEVIGIWLVVASILGALVLGLFVGYRFGYNARDRHWR